MSQFLTVMNSSRGAPPFPALPVSATAPTAIRRATVTGWDGPANGTTCPVGLVLMAAPRRYGGPTRPSGGAGQETNAVEKGPSIVGTPVAQVRGVLADRVVISTPLDPFLSLRALSAYSGLSVRKLREYLDDPAHPLPAYRVGGKILVRRSEFDAWVAQYREERRRDVGRVVEDVLRSL
jgi:excisionase family DNA binding protein